MSTETEAPELGNNEASTVRFRVDRRVEVAEQAGELKKKLAEYKAEDKADGLNEKAIGDAVKMRLAEPDKVLNTLLYELERESYRKAAGVPTKIEDAKRIAEAAAAAEPEPKSKKRAKGKSEGKRGGKGYN